MNQSQLLPDDTRTGHLTSSQVTKTFTPITAYRIGLGPWPRRHCVSFVMMHWLICNMTYMSHTSDQIIWPDLRSDFQITCRRPKCICFDLSRREQFSSTYLFQKIFAKTFILPVSNIFVWPVLGRWKCDLWLKNRVWLDSGRPRLAVRLCCESVLQLRGKWVGEGVAPHFRSRMANKQVRSRAAERRVALNSATATDRRPF